MIVALLAKYRATIIEFIKFGIVGVGGFVVDWAFFHIARDGLEWNAYASALFSFPFAVSFTWLGNRLFTFRDKKSDDIKSEGAKFAGVCAVGLVLNRGTFSLCTAFIPLVAVYPVLGLMAGTGAGMFFNFFFSKRLVFK